MSEARMFDGRTGAVLVVEDEPLIRMEAVDFLEEEGFTVVEARSADDGLAVLRGRADIRVLFTDVHVPGTLDGIALAWIAASEFGNVRLLVVSGRAAPGPGELPHGAVFLAKPYDASTVVGHVQDAIRSG